MIVFLIKALVISLSGVMAPGPVTAATIAAGTRRRHAGALVAVGHAVIEVPLMVLIMLGIGRLFQRQGVKIAIGLAGGAFLLLMGGQMLLALRKPPEAAAPPQRRHPLWTGVVLTGGCSALEGILDLAEEIFEAPVRLGIPVHVGGLQDVVRGPMYATGVGLVLYGAAQDRQVTRFRIRDDSIFGRVKQRMRDWFYQFE